jgi:hypothetical protein
MEYEAGDLVWYAVCGYDDQIVARRLLTAVPSES